MTVSDIERGNSATPTTVLKLAQALNVQPSELLEAKAEMTDETA